ncbi:DinB family protein [Corynebacterium sp. L4756]|uniref:DinB family protein n=1 Tax=unclassified Corynebacterium TaxID=2624378 RepID=UPI00374D99D8
MRGLLLEYLDYYRNLVISKLRGLSTEQLTYSNVPTQWTPAGMVNHLTNVERRWLEWGFLGRDVEDPWRDAPPDGGWITPKLSFDELKDLLLETGRSTRRLVEAHQLTEYSQVGGKFAKIEAAPQLHWILLHLLQEYARHVGHLDISRELINGATGEYS